VRRMQMCNGMPTVCHTFCVAGQVGQMVGVRMLDEAISSNLKELVYGASTNVLHIPSTAAALPAGWRWLRLEDVCSGVFDCPHSTPVLISDGPLIVRSQDIRSGVFKVDEAAHVSEDTYRERVGRAEPVYGDLLYSREGTYFGIAAEVPPSTRVCLGQRMVLLRPEPTRVHFRFLRYWLNSPVMASHIHGHRDGTVAERLNLPTIRGLPVALPPLSGQRAIAHILGTLDDKIELNRLMNETLEAMARVLFKSWFVDFDPVHAKAEGRDPGLPKDIAALFPDRFEDSELGEIPAGWQVKSLDEIARFLNGLALQKYPPKDGRSLPVIKIAQLRSENTNGADRASADLDPDYIVTDGDILFSWSGSLECVLWAGGSGALNQHLFKVTPVGYPKWLCYLGVHLHLDDFRHIAEGKATTMGHIQRHHLSDANLPAPSPKCCMLWIKFSNRSMRVYGSARCNPAPSPPFAIRCCPSSSPASCA
jgi:type I restriction enzyme, S subunit